jgi:hypothetical protein
MATGTAREQGLKGWGIPAQATIDGIHLVSGTVTLRPALQRRNRWDGSNVVKIPPDWS